MNIKLQITYFTYFKCNSYKKKESSKVYNKLIFYLNINY